MLINKTTCYLVNSSNISIFKTKNMEIYQPIEVNQKLIEAFNRLVPQLNDTIKPPTAQQLDDILQSDGTILFVGEENGKIVGTLSLVIYKIPTGIKAWIEDVIVDESVRGKGYGKELMVHAIEHTRMLGIEKLNLTSSPFRTAANKMYQNLEFKLRETNVYRMTL